MRVLNGHQRAAAANRQPGDSRRWASRFAGVSGWSGAGSNRRPSAFQVNRGERCADLRKRTSV